MIQKYLKLGKLKTNRFNLGHHYLQEACLANQKSYCCHKMQKDREIERHSTISDPNVEV